MTATPSAMPVADAKTHNQDLVRGVFVPSDSAELAR